MSNIKLTQIQLSNFNPRYTQIQLNFGIDKLREENNIYDELKVAKNLISYEINDLSTFYDLLVSLSQGYNKTIDKPLFIEGKNKDEFIVVEGNRRILALKLLNKLIKIDSLLLENNNHYKDIVNLVNDYNKKFDEFSQSDYELIENESDLWPSIYTRHVANSRGKRSWNRFKYLYDIYYFYKESKKTKEDKILLSSIRFNRSIPIIKNDLRSSIFVHDLIETYNKNNPKKAVDPFSDDISKNRGIRSSALEPNNLINIQINNESLVNYCGIVVKEDKYQIDDKKKKAKGKFNFDNFATFLIDSYFSKYFTTRGWKASHRFELIKFVEGFNNPILGEKLRIVSEVIPKSVPDNKAEFPTLNADFDDTNAEAVEAQQAKVNESASELQDIIENLASNFNDLEYPNSNEFIEAIRQNTLFLKRLSIGKMSIIEVPFTAIAASIRTIYEHIIYFIVSSLNEKDEYVNSISSKAKKLLHSKDAYIIFLKFRNRFDDKNNYESEIQKFCTAIKKAKKSTSSEQLPFKVLKRIGTIFKKEDWHNPINKLIHSMATMLKSNEEEISLRFLKLQISVINVLVKKIVS